MKPPDAVVIDGDVLPVRVRLLNRRDGLIQVGEYDRRTGRIELDPRQTQGYMRDTLLHEVLHAAFHRSGALALLRARSRRGDALEEELVSLVSPWLLEALRSPDVAEYLTS